MNRSVLKTNAKQQLGGSIFSEKWLLALVCSLIVSAVVSAVSGIGSAVGGGFGFANMFQMVQNNEFSEEMVFSMYPKMFAGTGISSIIVILISGPLSYGLAKIFLGLVYGEDRIDIGRLFDGFRDDFGGTVLLSLMIGIFTFLWMLLFIIPGIVKGLAYSMAYYVKVEHPDYNWRACLNESQTLMRGHKGEYFVLQLSFIGWYIVGMLTFGLGLLWVSPYVECANANFYAWLTAQNRPFSEPIDDTF